MKDWDGTERREALLLAEHIAAQQKKVEVSLATLIIGFATLAIMHIGTIWALIIVSGNLAHSNELQEEFRTQLRCFVVRTVQGTAGPDVLNDCGFLTIGGR